MQLCLTLHAVALCIAIVVLTMVVAHLMLRLLEKMSCTLDMDTLCKLPYVVCRISGLAEVGMVAFEPLTPHVLHAGHAARAACIHGATGSCV